MATETDIKAREDTSFRELRMGPWEIIMPYLSNKIRTSKYTVATWAPKSLLWQFRRAANIYFLIISILTAFPFSPKNPISMIATFAFVLIFTMFKELYEDYFRHK